MQRRLVTIPNPIGEWASKWQSIPGAFWLQTERNGKQVDKLCVPLSHRRAVTELDEDDNVYLVVPKNQTFVETLPGLRIIPSVPAVATTTFQKLPFKKAEQLSQSHEVYYSPIQMVHTQ